MNKLYSFLLSLLCLFSQAAYAQSLTYKQEAEQVLAPLNKNFIPTGVLYDRSFPLANLEAFTGTSTTDTASSDVFHQAYYEFYESSYNNTTLPSPEALASNLKANYSATDHAIGIFYNYFDILDTLAVKKNLLYVQNNQLYDVPGRTASPYLTRSTFIATPLAAPETEFTEGTHSFYLDPAYFFLPNGISVKSVSIDFNDGQGLQTINLNSNTTITNSTNSGSGLLRFIGRLFPGTAHIRLIVVLTDGKTLDAISRIFVRDKKIQITGCNGGDQIAIDGIPFNASAYGLPSGAAQGTAYVFYSNANCGTGRVTKPIIFIDGIDPGDKRGADKIYDEYINRRFIDLNGNETYLADKFRNGGYDLIIFDYKNGTDLIERNALAVVKLLEVLYQRYGNTMQEEFVLIGPSMGALVAQYALSYAEKNNIPHHTRLFISFDGPHQGANIAIGMQQFIDYLTQGNIVGSVFSSVKNGLHQSAAARQMLVHHSSTNSEVPASDNFRSIFLNNLNTVGKYPAGCRKVAVINGSRNGIKNPYIQPGNQLLQVLVKRRLGFCNGDICNKLNWQAYASTQSNRTKSMDMWTMAPLMNLVLWKTPRVTKYSQPLSGAYSYDVAPGSFFGDKDAPYSKSQAYADVIASLNYLFYARETKFNQQLSNFSFISTLSAVDYQPTTNNLYLDLTNENLTACSGKTPFDYVYAPSSSQPHVAITAQNAVWFENEIKGILPPPSAGNLGNIQGPSQFCTSATYIVPNLPSGTTVTWDGGTAATVTPQNASGSEVIVTKNTYYSGPISITATINPNKTNCQSSTTSKQITVGAPNYNTLSSSLYTGGTSQPLQGSNCLKMTNPNYPNMYSGELHLSDEVGGSFSWTLISKSPSSAIVQMLEHSPGHFTVNIRTKGATATYRLTRTNSCDSYSTDYQFIGDGPCFSNPEFAETPELYITPNPATATFTVSVSGGNRNLESMDLVVLNKYGQVMKRHKFGKSNNHESVDIQHLPPDVYVVQVFNGEKWLTSKVVKQ